MTHNAASDLLATAKKMSTHNLNHGAAGNISIRLDNGFMITPSALPYDQSTADDMVTMCFDGNVTSSTRKPSSEWRFHRDVYKNFSQAKAILHAHPTWCTTLACQHMEIPAFHYMIALAGGKNIRCADYATFGTQELSDNIIAALQERKACLMAHHGLLCFGENLQQVLDIAVEVEFLAQTYVQALQLGDVPLLSDRQMNEVIDKFSTYRA